MISSLAVVVVAIPLDLDCFFLKCRVLINNSFVTLFHLLLYCHMRDVLHIFKVVCLVNELVLEEHDMVLIVLLLTLVAACLLALVAGEHDFLVIMFLTIGLRVPVGML